MVAYKTRPGVVLCEICGEYVLVAAKALQDTCPYVSQINESSAFLWKNLEESADINQLVNAVKEQYDIENDIELHASIKQFVEQMLEMDYLIIIKSGDQNEKET